MQLLRQRLDLACDPRMRLVVVFAVKLEVLRVRPERLQPHLDAIARGPPLGEHADHAGVIREVSLLQHAEHLGILADELLRLPQGHGTAAFAIAPSSRLPIPTSAASAVQVWATGAGNSEGKTVWLTSLTGVVVQSGGAS